MNITIIADNRERASGIPELLNKNGVFVMLKQLVVGDYMIEDNIVIERKTNTDFVQSILNNHLFNQCARIKKTGLHALLIIEGNPFQTRHAITPEAIRGALMSVCLSWQIPVFRSFGIEDTTKLLIIAAKQHLTPTPFIRKTGIKPKIQQKQQHYLIQSLPGVGPTLAHRLLTHFKSVEQIVLADICALMGVNGMGKNKANQVYAFFRQESTVKDNRASLPSDTIAR